MKKLYQITIFSLTLICLPLSVSAQTMEDKIKSLEATVEQLQETLIKMRNEMEKAKEAEASAKDNVVRTDGEKITLSTTGGGLKLKSDNGNSFQFGGRLMWDYDDWDFDGDRASDGSDSEWRRTRITAKGTVKNDWAYGFTINIADEGGGGGGSADVNTAFMRYDGFKPLSITVGKFKEPFSLERLASSKWINTIERGMIIDVINEGHGQPQTGGAMLSGYYADMGNLNWAFGVFDDNEKDDDGDINFAYTGRIAAAPRINENSFFHLGFAYSERERDEQRYRVRTRFGVHTNNASRATLADLPSGDDISQFGLEAAFVTGPFSLQAEYVDMEVDGGTSDGLTYDHDDDDETDERDIIDTVTGDPLRYSDLDADGYYIQGAWTITGEQRSYKTKGAYFDKIKPKGPLGALELVLRYEEIDVEYGGALGNLPTNLGSGRADSEAEKMLLGLNWYANNNVKFMLNYIDAESEGRQDIDGDAITFRAQYAF